MVHLAEDLDRRRSRAGVGALDGGFDWWLSSWARTRENQYDNQCSWLWSQPEKVHLQINDTRTYTRCTGFLVLKLGSLRVASNREWLRITYIVRLAIESASKRSNINVIKIVRRPLLLAWPAESRHGILPLHSSGADIGVGLDWRSVAIPLLCLPGIARRGGATGFK